MKTTLSTLLLLLCSYGAQAQTAFSYQGTLRNAGVLKNGEVDLEVRLFDAASGGSQVGSTVALNDVTAVNGVFNSTLDFGASFGGADRYLEISVANSSGPGPSTSYTTLNPRQRVNAVPYASSVIDGAVTTSKLANQSVTSSKLAPGSITSAQLAANAVNAAALADNAVDTAAMQDLSVTNPKLADGSITGAKLAAGAIGAAQINSSQVQLRINGECPLPLLMNGINADGSVRCDVVASNASVNFAAGGTPGPLPRVAIRSNGLPVILFRAKVPSNQATLYFCNDVTCSSGLARSIASANYFDFYLGADDRARLFFGSADTLTYRECVDVLCASTSAPATLVGTNRLGRHVAVAVRSDGRPVVFGGSNNTPGFVYELLICGNANCSSGNVVVPIPGSSGTVVAQSQVLLRADNAPILIGRVGVSFQRFIYSCADAACSSGTTLNIGTTSGLGLVAHLPASGIAEFYYADPGIKRVACTTAACTALGTVSDFDTSVTTTTYIALSVRSQLRLLYSRTTDFVLAACNDASCSAPAFNTIGKAVPTIDEDSGPSMWIRPDGRIAFPSMQVTGANDSQLRFYTCARADCAP